MFLTHKHIWNKLILLNGHFTTKRVYLLDCHTRAIITRGLYIFYAIFESQKCFLRSLFCKILYLCMASIQERVILARIWYTQNGHLKFKWSNAFGCQWFIPWLVDAIHQSSFQWSKSGLHCSQMTSIQMCMQTPPTSGFELAKKSTLWSKIQNLIWKFSHFKAPNKRLNATFFQ